MPRKRKPDPKKGTGKNQKAAEDVYILMKIQKIQ